MKNKTILKTARYAGAVLIMFMLFVLMIFIKTPVYVIGDIRIENINSADAALKIEDAIEKFKNTKKLVFSSGGKKISIDPLSIEARWDAKATVAELKKYRNLKFTNEPIRAGVYTNFNKDKLINKIKEFYKDEIKQMSPAKIAYSARGFKIIESQEGAALEEENLIKAAKYNLENLSGEEIKVEFKRIPPPITTEDLSVYFDTITAALNRQIKMQYGFISFTFLPRMYLDAIYYQKELTANGESVKIKLNPEEINKSFISQITQTINKKASPIKIYKNTSGQIIFEGESETGEEVDTDQLIELTEIALNENVRTVKIPVIETPPQIISTQELKDMGIKELISVGHTSFYRSPANRVHNIIVGVSKFNGTLIAPNEEFSFNKKLGRVDASTGYLEELVIKPEGTLPEYGGGLCQVSTTMYRAAIYAGLPITERWPHSYAVTYYAQIGGHGLDATVYPGARDLKFKNNTPGYILVQSYVKGMEAYFKFYGTSDGRKIILDGPYLSNFRSAGQAETIKTTKLKPGERKKIESAGKGFDAVWYRIIRSADGKEEKEKIFSSYRATADRFLEGVQEEAASAESQTEQPAQEAKEFKD